MVRVTVKSTGTIRKYLPQQKDIITIELEEPISVSELLYNKLELEIGVIMAILIDGKNRKEDYILNGGEEVILVAPLGGG